MMVSPIFEMIDNCMIDNSNFSMRQDEEWTAWKQSLQIATVFHLQPDENWSEQNETNPKIQIKRMTASEVIDKDINIPAIDLQYDDILDVVKLPMAIPDYDNEDAPDFLFIRPDDYDLFYSMHLRRRIILLGNPGISKSWFHWKYLLFCFHPELYNEFKPDHKLKQKPQHDEQTEDDQKVTATPSSPKKQKRESHMIEKKSKFDGIETIPEVVVRTIFGIESQIFVINFNDPVKVVNHLANDLKLFTTKKMTILWEPDAGKESVQYTGVKALLIATLSPEEERYKEFHKVGAKILYLPCPSEVQLRIMGQIIAANKTDETVVLDQTIKDRIKDFGPFIRIVFSNDKDILEVYKSKRTDELNALGDRNLGKLMTNISQVSENGVGHLSHRIVRYMVNRNDDGNDFYGYGQKYFICACDVVVTEIQKMILSFGEETIIDHLVKINNGTNSLEQFIPKYLERVAVIHLTSTGGLEWESRSLMNADSEWLPISLKFSELELNCTKYSDMKPQESLCHPINDFFPLVDMYWRDETKLLAIQATRSVKHPKSFATYETFFKKLDVDINKTHFIFYFLIMPNQKAEFTKNKKYPDHYFYTNVQNKPEGFGAKFEFFALCPPQNFLSGTK